MAGRKRKLRTGSRTCGRGKKSGRGAGIHGGRGNAGLHKHKIMSVIKYDPFHFGMYGFKRPQSVVSSNIVINVDALKELLDRQLKLTGEKEPEMKGGLVMIDLEKHGFDKLLGNGSIALPVHVRVAKASEQAIAKIEGAGGKVELIA